MCYHNPGIDSQSYDHMIISKHKKNVFVYLLFPFLFISNFLINNHNISLEYINPKLIHKFLQ